MIHVNVIEALDCAGLSVLDQRVVGATEITEAALPRRLHALGSHFQDLLLRGKPRKRVAGHVDELAVRSVPHLRNLEALSAEILVVFTRIGRIPAEVPDSGLRPVQFCLGWCIDLGEEQIKVAGLDRRVAVEGGLRGRDWKRFGVVRGGSARVHGIQVNVMNVHRRDVRRLLRKERPRRQRQSNQRDDDQAQGTIAHCENSSRSPSSQARIIAAFLIIGEERQRGWAFPGLA